jgi:hypothetical protein
VVRFDQRCVGEGFRAASTGHCSAAADLIAADKPRCGTRTSIFPRGAAATPKLRAFIDTARKTLRAPRIASALLNPGLSL